MQRGHGAEQRHSVAAVRGAAERTRTARQEEREVPCSDLRPRLFAIRVTAQEMRRKKNAVLTKLLMWKISDFALSR